MPLPTSARPQLAHIALELPIMRNALYYHRVPGMSGNRGGNGAPISFELFPFMVEPWSIIHREEEVSAQKCTQVGWTELAMAYVMAAAGHMGRRLAYVMPHDAMVAKFQHEKFQPMIDMSPHYQRLMAPKWRERPVKNLKIRHIGNGSVQFLGSRVQASMRSFTADAVVIDEVDECHQGNLAMLRDRFRRSDSPQMIRLGNPSLPDEGITAIYDRSDGRRWMHRCEHCAEMQPIEWEMHVVRRDDRGRWVPRDRERAAGLDRRTKRPDPGRDIRPVCRRCDRGFNRQTSGWQWVAQRPTEPARGYHVSQMDVPGQPLWALFLEFLEAQGDPTKMRAFYAGVLGIAFDASGSRVTLSDLRECTKVLDPYQMDFSGGESYRGQVVTAGVDVGSVMNVQISSYTEVYQDESEADEDGTAARQTVYVGALPEFDAIRAMILAYNIDVLVIDHGPERTKTEELRDWAHANTSCRVWLCNFYLASRAEPLKWGIRLDENASGVQVDRTQLLDGAFADILKGRHAYPEDVFTVPDFERQMGAPVRKLDGARYVWDEGSKPDHYRLADAYDALAFELLNASPGFYEVDIG